MITPSSPVVIPPSTGMVADGLWIMSLNISAPSTSGKIQLTARICPFVSSNGTLLTNQAKIMRVNDVATLAQTDTTIATAMGAVYAAVQEQVTGQGLF